MNACGCQDFPSSWLLLGVTVYQLLADGPQHREAQEQLFRMAISSVLSMNMVCLHLTWSAMFPASRIWTGHFFG